MSTYVLGSDDALLPWEQAWWQHALAAVRYTAARLPMDTGRVILACEVGTCQRFSSECAVHAIGRGLIPPRQPRYDRGGFV